MPTQPEVHRWKEAPNVIGLRGVERKVRRYVSTGMPILIEGETGVGKTTVAAAIKDIRETQSGQKIPLIKRHGATLTQPRLISGYNRAQTGSGVLVIESITDAPVDIYDPLIAYLNQSVAQKVQVVITLNTSLGRQNIAASHRGLGRFSEFNEVTIPPLRDRRKEVVPLALSFAQDEGIEAIADNAQAFLVTRNFPGNVLQLHTIVKTAIAVRKDRSSAVLTREDLERILR